ncbi:MAG: TonB-dependent receptor, partial [Pyrinomonadaceae bacterium]
LPLRSGANRTEVEFADREEIAFSPRASILYQATPNLTFSISGYRAYRAPTLNELYRSFRVGDVLTQANEDLLAERLSGGEVGALYTTFNRRLTARGTFFWSEITRPIANVTLSVVPGLITRQRQNLGRTRSRGIEAETEFRLNSHWQLSAGYLYTDAVVTRFPTNISLEGLLIPQTPRHQFTTQLFYSNPSLWSFGVQSRASGIQFDDDQNRLALNRYFTLDLFASRHITEQIEAFVAAENLFNSRYEIGKTPVATIASPISVRVGFRFNFGSR